MSASKWKCISCTEVNQDEKCSFCGVPRPPLPVEQKKPELETKILKPETLFVSDISQFSFGKEKGESACPFGTLAIAERLLSGFLDITGDQKVLAIKFEETLRYAVWCYEEYFGKKSGPHTGPLDIIADKAFLYPQLKLQIWTEKTLVADKWKIPSCFEGLSSSLVFPEALMPTGEIQIRNFDTKELILLLNAFKNTGSVLTFVNIGYVFRVQCKRGESFIIFDTHSKDCSSFKGKTGAYLLKVRGVEYAVDIILNFCLISRKQILKLVEGTEQTEAANNLSVSVFSLR